MCFFLVGVQMVSGSECEFNLGFRQHDVLLLLLSCPVVRVRCADYPRATGTGPKGAGGEVYCRVHLIKSIHLVA